MFIKHRLRAHADWGFISLYNLSYLKMLVTPVQITNHICRIFSTFSAYEKNFGNFFQTFRAWRIFLFLMWIICAYGMNLWRVILGWICHREWNSVTHLVCSFALSQSTFFGKRRQNNDFTLQFNFHISLFFMSLLVLKFRNLEPSEHDK